MMDYTFQLKRASIDDLYQISLKSAKSREKLIYIYEKSDLSNIVGKIKAENLRKIFLKNKIKVMEITNIPVLPKFSENDQFTNECMSFRYIPKYLFTIKNEVLIFDDTVAIYNVEPSIKLAIIEDKSFAENQKQLFKNIWDLGQPPKLKFRYKPNHSFYNSFNFNINGKELIVYPDKDAKKSYSGMSNEDIKKYFINIISRDRKYFSNYDYLVAFIWNYKNNKMADIWKFASNYIDDRSGPTGEVRVYRNGKKCDTLGMASGNTLLVLGYEEKLRRQSKNLSKYLSGPLPKLPLELMNGKNFFNK